MRITTGNIFSFFYEPMRLASHVETWTAHRMLCALRTAHEWNTDYEHLVLRHADELTREFGSSFPIVHRLVALCKHVVSERSSLAPDSTEAPHNLFDVLTAQEEHELLPLAEAMTVFFAQRETS